jgi:hypothetical protein
MRRRTSHSCSKGNIQNHEKVAKRELRDGSRVPKQELRNQAIRQQGLGIRQSQLGKEDKDLKLQRRDNLAGSEWQKWRGVKAII